MAKQAPDTDKGRDTGLDLKQEHFTKAGSKLCKYLPHWHDKYIYRMLQITTLQGNNSNQKWKTLSLAYAIRKYLFLSKDASNEEIGVRILSFILLYLHVCMYACMLFGCCAKIVFACSTNTLQWHFCVTLKKQLTKWN